MNVKESNATITSSAALYGWSTVTPTPFTLRDAQKLPRFLDAQERMAHSEKPLPLQPTWLGVDDSQVTSMLKIRHWDRRVVVHIIGCHNV